MSKELIVSVNGREKKIAIVEDDLVTEFYVERGDENQGIVGNIYKGRVMKVLPGMQSAFVDIGLERDSFLTFLTFSTAMSSRERLKTARNNHKRNFNRNHKRDRNRNALPNGPRPQREAPAEPSKPQVNRMKNYTMVALRHIEEIAEEPVIEPSEDDLAAIENDGDGRREPGAAAEADPRRRRQRRLRYNAPEEVTGQPAEKEVASEKRSSQSSSRTSKRSPRDADAVGRAVSAATMLRKSPPSQPLMRSCLDLYPTISSSQSRFGSFSANRSSESAMTTKRPMKARC
jgi:ribonuclease G